MPKKKIIIYPYLFAVYPILYLFKVNIDQTGFHVILLPLSALIVFTYLLIKILNKYFKNEDKTAVGVSFFYLWLFSYSAIRSTIMYEIFGVLFYRHRYFIVIWFIVLLVLLIFYLKAKWNYQRLSEYMKYLSYIMFSLIIIQILANLLKELPDPQYSQKDTQEVEAKISVEKESLPDIYYIILDAYSGQVVLKDVLGFDNSEFLNYLRDKGFYIADSSHSNYAWTALSITSSLNMDYLPVKSLNNDSSQLTIDPSYSLYKNIVDNKFEKILKEAGYKFQDLSIWSNTSLRYTNPRNYSEQFITNNFNLALIQMTFLGRPLVDNFLLAYSKRTRIQNKFTELKNISNDIGPQFVYAHILIPHHPYVFSQDGSPPNFFNGVLELGSDRKLYIEQLIYANKEIIKVVDAILKKRRNGVDPIIIIQGDHGAFNLGKNKKENIKLRMNILNAYYVTESCKKILYKSITPVNSFRAILNSYFGVNNTLIPDKSFYSSLEDNKNILEVTDQLTK